jgi:hypothetical protein
MILSKNERCREERPEVCTKKLFFALIDAIAFVTVSRFDYSLIYAGYVISRFL